MDSKSKLDIFVSAGESSSDIHCARLIQELKKKLSNNEIKTFGLGGDALAKEGCSLFLHCREFSVMGGFFEVIKKLPLRRKLERLLEEYLFAFSSEDLQRAKKPALAILVDNGEINLRLAALFHFFEIPVIYFIPPKVWVWRFWRMEKIAQHVNLVLSILPFEEEIYKEWDVPFQYIGNPLIDELPLSLTQAEAKRILNIPEDRSVLAVLPGSRHTEIQHHVDLFSKAIQIFLAKVNPKPQIVIPIASHLDFEKVKTNIHRFLPEAKCVQGQSHICLKAARAALVKSGTSTLEAAVLGTPLVLSYRSSLTAEWTYKHIVRYRGFVGLVNLFLCKPSLSALGWGPRIESVVPELILDQCKPEIIANELAKIYEDTPEREKMLNAISKAKEVLLPCTGGSSLEYAAGQVLKILRETVECTTREHGDARVSNTLGESERVSRSVECDSVSRSNVV